MAKTDLQFEILELPGDQYPDLAAAQQAARRELASDLLQILSDLIELGMLEIKDGNVIPKR